jgi:hypothetical protein
MSKISTVYDTLLATVGTLLPSGSGYTRIPNPNNLEDNMIQFMRKGYGLVYSGGNQAEGEICNFVIEHTFTVILTREVVKLDSQTDQLDAVNKALLEDAYKLQNDIYNVDEIGIPNDITQVLLGSIGSISDVIIGKKYFKSIEVNFDIQVTETIV